MPHGRLLDVGRDDSHVTKLSRDRRQGTKPRTVDTIIIGDENTHGTISKVDGWLAATSRPAPCLHLALPSCYTSSSEQRMRVTMVHNPTAGENSPTSDELCDL